MLGNASARASVPGEIVPSHEFYDFDDKYLDGAAELRVPAPLSDEATERVRALAVQAYRALRVDGMARVDFFYEEDGRGLPRQRAEHDPRVHARSRCTRSCGRRQDFPTTSWSTSSCASRSSATNAAPASTPNADDGPA